MLRRITHGAPRALHLLGPHQVRCMMSPGSAGDWGAPPGSPYGGQQQLFSPSGRSLKPANEYVQKLPMNFGLNIVPQGELWVVERLGKYKKTVEPGLSVLIPMVDKIAYVHSSKEQAHEIPDQSAITQDNVVVYIDGILFMRVLDARKASYNIDNAIYNLIMVAQTTMRSEIGKLTLDRLFEERQTLNHNIRSAISVDAKEWGIECKRYEIRDIQVSDIVRKSMDLQAEADRIRRKSVLESEGDRDAMTNRALGEKNAREMRAEAEKTAAIRMAEGDAERLRLIASAQAEAIERVSDSIRKNEGAKEAMNLEVAKGYINSFGNIAKETNTVVLPANMQDPSAMIASAMSVYSNLNKHNAAAAAPAVAAEPAEPAAPAPATPSPAAPPTGAPAGVDLNGMPYASPTGEPVYPPPDTFPPPPPLPPPPMQ